MVYIRFFLLLWLTFLISCNTSVSNPPDWSIDVRQGFTSLDDTFLLSSAAVDGSASKQKVESLQVELHKHGLPIIFPQSTVGFALNIYVSINFKDNPPATDLPVSLIYPNNMGKATLTYPANSRWNMFSPIQTGGGGKYILSVPISDKTLSTSFTVNASPTEFPIASINKLGATSSEVSAVWNQVPNASHYIALIYDYSLKKFVKSESTTTTSITLDGLDLKRQQTYGLVLFALSWDASLPTNQPYPIPLPEQFNASVMERQFRLEDPDIGDPIPNPLGLYGELGERPKASVRFRNDSTGTGLLKYSASIVGSNSVRILNTIANKVFVGDSDQVDLEGICPNTELQENATLVIQSNDPDEASKAIPIQIECLAPTRSSLIFSKQGQNNIQHVAWSNDGSKVVASGDRTFIWNTTFGEWIRSLDITGVISWSPDSLYVVGSFGNTAKVLNAATGAEVRQLGPLRDSSEIKRAAWSPDGSKIAIASTNRIGIYSATTGSALLEINPMDSVYEIGDIEWSPDSTKIATGASDLVIWNSVSGSEILRIRDVQGAIAWKPDGTQITSGNISNKSLSIWNALTGDLIRNVGTTPNFPGNLLWKGNRLISYTFDISGASRVDIYTASSGVIERRIPMSGIGSYTPLSVSPDGQQFVAASTYDSAKLWSTTTGIAQMTLGFQSGFVEGLAFSHDNTKLLASISNNIGSYLIWLGVASGNQLGKIDRVGASLSNVVTWVESSNRIGAVGEDTTGSNMPKAYIWDTTSRSLVSSFTLPSRSWSAWNTAGTKLAVLNEGGSIQIYSTSTGTSSLTLADSISGFPSVPAWNRGGDKVAASLVNRGNFIWDANTGTKLQQFQNSVVGQLIWSFDSRKILGKESGRIFDATSGNIVAVNNNMIGNAAWAPDGKRIAVASNLLSDQTIRIFSSFTGRELLAIPNSQLAYHNKPIVWSSDGKYLASGGSSQLSLWEIMTSP